MWLRIPQRHNQPGDSYLWKLQPPNGFPISYQMWVKIFRSWSRRRTWDEMESDGKWTPTLHPLKHRSMCHWDMGEPESGGLIN